MEDRVRRNRSDSGLHPRCIANVHPVVLCHQRANIGQLEQRARFGIQCQTRDFPTARTQHHRQPGSLEPGMPGHQDVHGTTPPQMGLR